MTTILDLLEDAASGPGTATFVPAAPEPQPIANLLRSSQDAARWLSERVEPGGAVGMVLASTPACAASLFGAWRCGFTVTSLPTPSRGMAIDEYFEQLARMCSLVGAEHILLDPGYASLVPDVGLHVHAFDETVAGGYGRPCSGVGELVQFTSGSTGSPKGVRLSLTAIAANINSILDRLDLPPGTVSCSWLPLSHDMGLIGMFLGALAAGAHYRASASCVLVAPEVFLARPSVWLASCSEYRATATTAPNFALELAIRTSRWTSDADLSSLQIVITGAERVRADTLRRFSATFEQAGFRNVALCPAYGLAEASLAVTIVPPSAEWTSRSIDPIALAEGNWVDVAPGAGIELVSNGSAIPEVGVRIAAMDDGLGEIEISGPSMLDDYVGADLRLASDGWFPTKDIGRIIDGELYVTGRIDDMIVIAGRNFYASDIEEAAGRVDLVRAGRCAVVPSDEGDYVVLAEARRGVTDVAELEDGCRRIKEAVTRATGTGASAVAIVKPGSLPMTPSGKLRRFQVRQRFEEGELPWIARVDFRRGAIRGRR